MIYKSSVHSTLLKIYQVQQGLAHALKSLLYVYNLTVKVYGLQVVRQCFLIVGSLGNPKNWFLKGDYIEFVVREV